MSTPPTPKPEHGSGHAHHHQPHDQEFGAAFWDDMYRRRSQAWDGEPNALLTEAVAGRAPGSALDVGCGEGADAIWLSERGWQVTAVDLSQVALDRGRAADTTERVQWVQADLTVWQPPEAAFDLVSTHFLHFPTSEREAFFARLARAVRPNGTLLLVAHHPSDLEAGIGRWNLPDLYFTAEEVASQLDAERWEIEICGTHPREVTDPAGRRVTIHDTVLRARRIA